MSLASIWASGLGPQLKTACCRKPRLSGTCESTHRRRQDSAVCWHSVVQLPCRLDLPANSKSHVGRAQHGPAYLSGATQPKFMRVLSYASRCQAKTRTITVWQRRKAELDQVRSDHGAFGWQAKNAHSNPWWDTPPAVDFIAEAAGGFESRFGKLEQNIKANTLECSSLQRKDSIRATTTKIMHPHVHDVSIADEA